MFKCENIQYKVYPVTTYSDLHARIEESRIYDRVKMFMFINCGGLIDLTEFWIVHALARHPGHVRNRQQLMDAASVVLDDNTITSHIKRIRRKFQSIDPGFAAIDTAYGVGYRWKGG